MGCRAGDLDDDAASVDAVLCPTVQAWADQTVDAVKAFRLASRELEDPAARRELYLETFARVGALHARLADALADVEMAEAVRTALDESMAAVEVNLELDVAEAEGLPSEDYEAVAVRNGSLVTGVEKSKAIVFNTLADLADDPSTEIPRGCGRRAALDLSPSATFPS